MKSSLGEVVCEVVARHVGVAPSMIDERKTVQRDLELDPLDLVLIALRLEEIEEIEFPIARLEGVRTVGDLTAIVHSVHAARFRAALRAAEGSAVSYRVRPARSTSGSSRASTR